MPGQARPPQPAGSRIVPAARTRRWRRAWGGLSQTSPGAMRSDLGGSRTSRPTRARPSIPAVACLSLLALLSAGLTVLAHGAHGQPRAMDHVARPTNIECDPENPSVVFARTPGLNPDGIAVALARDTEDDRFDGSYGNLVALARRPRVGTVHGVAFDSRHEVAYVGAVAQGDMALGPLGLGGIYRIRVLGRAVDDWTTLAAGTLDAARPLDRDVGRLGLGDLDMAGDGKLLFAANSYDRQVYVLSVEDATEMAVIPSPARAESWFEDSILFGLGVRGEYVYQGVVDSGYRYSSSGGPVRGYVYRTRFDGTEAERVASIDLDYARTPRWRSWGFVESSSSVNGTEISYPILSDIDFDVAGNMYVGLLDANYYRAFPRALPYGDVLRLSKRSESLWVMDSDSDFLDDDLSSEGRVLASEVNVGPLAILDSIGRLVVAGAALPAPGHSGAAEALKWYDTGSGDLSGPADGKEWISNDDEHTGDIEAACVKVVPETPTPAPTPSPSPSPTTLTPTWTPSATPSGASEHHHLYLPAALADECYVQDSGVDIVLVVDLSTSMLRITESGRSKLTELQDAVIQFVQALSSANTSRADRIRVGIVGFNYRSWVEQELTSDVTVIDSAVTRLSERVREGTRLDLALASGTDALTKGMPVSERERGLVLFTDGLPNGVPTPTAGGSQEDTVLAEAQRAKALGITIFAVGFGRRAAPGVPDGINDQLLRAIASAPHQYFETERGDDLRRIYMDIGREVRCR